MLNNSLDKQMYKKIKASVKESHSENLIVYEALKNTVLHCEDCGRNARIYMYVVYFAVLTIYFTSSSAVYQSHWLILLSFLVLITFQTMIHSSSIAIERISSYIRIFFETKRNDMHWSLLNKDKEHLAFYNATYQNIGWHINYWGATLLAFVSLIIIIYQILSDHSICEWTIYDLVEIIIGCSLFYLVFFINKGSYINNEKHRDSISNLDKSIEKFYNKYY